MERLRASLASSLPWALVAFLSLGASLFLTWWFFFGSSDAAKALTDGRVVVLNLAAAQDDAVKVPVPEEPKHEETPEEPPRSDVEPVKLAPPAPAHADDLAPLAAVTPDLGEKVEEGVLPAVAADGRRSWEHYGREIALKDSEPAIAIVIVGLGQNKAVSDAAAQLPPEFSLSFLPYADNVMMWADAARARGHEVFVDLPVETDGYPNDDPGPKGLLASDSEETRQEKLRWILTRTQGTVGVVLPPDERLSDDADSMAGVLQFLKRRGVMALIGHTAEKPTLKDAGSSAAPLLEADMTVDEALEAGALENRLKALEKLAESQGQAIAVARAYPLTIQTLKGWAAGLEARGIRLVPVSALAKRRFS